MAKIAKIYVPEQRAAEWVSRDKAGQAYVRTLKNARLLMQSHDLGLPVRIVYRDQSERLAIL